jgi:subtilisin family serine protease
MKQLEKLGVEVVARSKWMNTVSIYSVDSSLVDRVKELNFVKDVYLVWKGDTAKTKEPKALFKKTQTLSKNDSTYGYAYDQMQMMNGKALHDKGYTGKGQEIAVIDAGYKNLPDIILLDNISIRGVKDFVYQAEDMVEGSDHGLKVLSVMGTNRPSTYIGTAPAAKYWLLRSEDARSEYPIEEDYWVAAAEYADSVGVDIINTSLGYSTFNAPTYSYSYNQLDGKTAFISQAAQIATQKGILVVISAGNEGNTSWHKISVPADALDVLTVGAIRRDSLMASFSSRGPSFDGRTKPDVVALGNKIAVIAANGEIGQTSGTSFAAPVVSGLASCLWQAYPMLTSLQLLDIIKRSAHKHDDPDNSFGYGIPNMQKAMSLADMLLKELKK